MPKNQDPRRDEQRQDEQRQDGQRQDEQTTQIQPRDQRDDQNPEGEPARQ